VTVLAAYRDHTGATAIGCDTGVTFRTMSRVATKLVKVGPWTIGVAGSALWVRFLTEVAEAPPASLEALSDAWLEWARARGQGATEDRTWSISGELLAASVGEIAIIDGSGTVHRFTEPYAAGGAGEEVARGVMFAASHDHAASAGHVVRVAILAAVHHEPSCGGEPLVITLEAE
jgi:ATP-dependent protease HslVU (ClpYQ) peptidase subunit